MPETGERGRIIEQLLVAEARLPDKLDLRFIRESGDFFRIDQLLSTAEDQINSAIRAIEGDVLLSRRFYRKIEDVCQIPAAQMEIAETRIKDYQSLSKNNLNESNLKKLITAYNQIIFYLQNLKSLKEEKLKSPKPKHLKDLRFEIDGIF
jgi:hypothetical protein